MMLLSYHSSNLSLIALETIRLLVLTAFKTLSRTLSDKLSVKVTAIYDFRLKT